MPDFKRKLPPISDLIASPARVPRPERFGLCAVCAQSYDRESVGELLYHARIPHAPMRMDA